MDLVPDLPDIINSLDDRITNLEREPTSSRVDTRLPDLTIYNLTSTIVRYNDFTGAPRAKVILNWDDIPAISTDIFNADPFDHFEVSYVFQGDNTDTGGRVTVKESTATFYDLPANQNITFTVQALTKTNFLGPTSQLTLFTDKDTTPPIQPSTPVVVPGLKVLQVTWNGKDVNGDSMEADFRYVEVHIGTNATFTPSTTTLVDRLLGAGSTALYLDDFTIKYIRLVAVDSSGNKSVTSTAASGTPKKAVETDMNIALPGDIAYRDEGNLVPDGSFESLTMRSMRDSASFEKSSGYPVWDNTAGMAYSGVWCLNFIGDGTPQKYRYLTFNGAGVSSSTVTPGTKLYIAFRSRGISANGSVMISIRWIDSSGGFTYANTSINTTSNGSYILTESVVVVPVGAVFADFAVRTQLQTLGNWYVDDIQVRQIVGTSLIEDAAITSAKISDLAVTDAKVANLSGTKINANTITSEKFASGVLSTNNILDPSFEDKYLMGARGENGWKVINQGTSTINKLGKYGRSGSSCCLITFTSVASNITIESNQIEVSVNQSWKITAYVASTVNDSTVSISIYYYNGSTWTEQVLKTFSITATGPTPTPDDYTKIFAGYDVVAGVTSVKVRISVSTSSSTNGAVRIDDVALLPFGGTGASELTAAGLRLFDGYGDEIGALVSNRPNYFSVTKDDQSLASVTKEGHGYFQNVLVGNKLLLQGQSIEDKFGRGLVAYGSVTTPVTRSATTEVGMMEFFANIYANRTYLIIVRPSWIGLSSGTNTAATYFLRGTQNGTRPTVLSGLMAVGRIFIPTAGTHLAPPPLFAKILPASESPTVFPLKMLQTVVRASGSGSVEANCDWYSNWEIHDMGTGSYPLNTQTLTSTGGGSGAVPTSVFDSTWSCSAFTVMHPGTDTPVTLDEDNPLSGKILEGYGRGYTEWNDVNHSTLAYFQNNAVEGETTKTLWQVISSSTIVGAWIYVDCTYTYNPNGGRMLIRRGDIDPYYPGPLIVDMDVKSGGTYLVPIPVESFPLAEPYQKSAIRFGPGVGNNRNYHTTYNPATLKLRLRYTR